ncbi:hypothetical protein ILUMI_17789 [Ignelater luminosus]|uniref:Reverse transcriptase Ty1/copia-type domain-containing protein n=1 Tax=Ignelater luminosus TaxID=2038154 RepID=A0A8K0CJ86_IGNLU|nr:hypothetical protein ILUMI_17789 [Ignelater luminosus]
MATPTRSETANVPKFDGSNFQLWKFSVTILLKAEKFLTIVNETDTKPEDKDSSEWTAWDTKNSGAQVILLTTINQEQMQHLLNCENDAQVWTRLISIHEQKTEVSKELLWQKFYEYRIEHQTFENLTARLLKEELRMSNEDTALQTSFDVQTNKWICDSGASMHMICHKEWFSKLEPLDEPIHVKTAHDTVIAAEESGIIEIQALTDEDTATSEDQVDEIGDDPDYEHHNFDAEEVEQRQLRDRGTLRRSRPDHFDAVAAYSSIFEQNSYEYAVQCEDSNKWHRAIDDEINALKFNDTWTLVKLLENARVIYNKWVFHVKTDADGNPIRYKARLVARGFTQEKGVDYQETFAPVVRYDSIRILLALAARKDLRIANFDVQTTFLYLFGYLCAQRLLLSKSSSAIDELISKLQQMFKITVIRDNTNLHFVGLQIEQNIPEGTISIHQQSYTTKVLDTFKMTHAKPPSVPVEPGVCLTSAPDDGGGNLRHPYREASPEHWRAVERILWYLQQTLQYKITYSKTGQIEATEYTDADYAGCADTRKSTSGYIFIMANGPVTWKSQKQMVVAQSTTEAEYTALALGVKRPCG